MLIEYPNGRRKEVRDTVGRALVKIKGVKEVSEGSYLTRDMADQPKVAKVLPELDSAGNAWDENLHVASKLKNLNGTWRKKPGAAAQESAE